MVKKQIFFLIFLFLFIFTINLVSAEFNLTACLETACKESYLDDGHCDLPCNISVCDYDKGDCNLSVEIELPYEEQECAPGCPRYFLNDGYCDEQCNVEECDFDRGDCDDLEEENETSNETELCAPGCLPAYLEDEYCDIPCNNSVCNYDNGACEQNIENDTSVNQGGDENEQTEEKTTTNIKFIESIKENNLMKILLTLIVVVIVVMVYIKKIKSK